MFSQTSCCLSQAGRNQDLKLHSRVTLTDSGSSRSPGSEQQQLKPENHSLNLSLKRSLTKPQPAFMIFTHCQNNFLGGKPSHETTPVIGQTVLLPLMCNPICHFLLLSSLLFPGKPAVRWQGYWTTFEAKYPCKTPVTGQTTLQLPLRCYSICFWEMLWWINSFN